MDLRPLARLRLGVPVVLHEAHCVAETGLCRRTDRIEILRDRGLGLLDQPGPVASTGALDKRIANNQARPSAPA